MLYRILSLSGSGIRGIFQAVYLQALTKSLKTPFWKNFDLVAGAGTGSITALGVALEIDLGRIVNVFQLHGRTIFKPRPSASLPKGPRYSEKPLRAALESLFERLQLRDCRTQVVVPAANAETAAPRAFSTLQDPGLANPDLALFIVDVALASCAAPTLFPPAKPAGERRTYVDGAMWANNPSLSAVTHTVCYKKVPLNNIRLLSIGGSETIKGASFRRYTTLPPTSPDMVAALSEMLLATQSQAANDMVAMLIGEKNVMRIQPPLDQGLGLDHVDEALERLPPLAEAEALNDVGHVKAFLEGQDVAPVPPATAATASESQYEFDVFLSHNNADSARVEDIALKLRDRHRLRVWLDKWEVLIGSPHDQCMQGIEKSRFILLAVSQAALSSKWVAAERDWACVRDPRGLNVVPLIFEEVDLPPDLKSLNFQDFRDPAKDAESTERLAALLQATMARLGP